MPVRSVRRVVLAYATLAAAYILFSDHVLHALGLPRESLHKFATLKGLGFVAITSLLLWVLLRRMRDEEVLRYRSVFENHHAPMLLVDLADGALVDANLAAEVFYGWTRDELRAMRITQVNMLPPEQVAAALERAQADGRHEFHFRHCLKSGEARDVLVHSGPVQWGRRRLLFSIVHDETERLSGERALRRTRRLFELLSSTNTLIVRNPPEVELFNRTCRIAVERGGFLAAWVGRAVDGRLEPLARAGDDHGHIDALGILLDGRDQHGRGPAATALRDRTRVVVNEYGAEPSLAPWHASAAASGIRAMAAFPLRRRGEVVAILVLYAGESGFFGADELATLDEMAGDLSFALDNAQSLAERDAAMRSLEVASQVVESSPVVLFRWRPAEGWPVEFVSSNVARWGFDAARFLSGELPYARVLHPDDLARVGADVAARLARGEQEYEQRYRLVAPDGRVLHVVDRTSVERDAEGRVVRLSGLVFDETAQVAAEADRRKSEQLLSFALERAPVALAVQDLSLRYTALRYAPQPGIERDAVGRTDVDLLGPDEGARIEAQKRAVLETEVQWKGDFTAWIDGAAHEFDAVVDVMRDARGEAAGVWTFAVDVTERRRLFAALRTSEQRYRAMFDENPHAMWLVDRQSGKLLAVNDAAVAQYGYTRNELLVKRAEDLRAPRLPGDDGALAGPFVPDARGRVTFERHRRKDGSVFVAEVSSARLSHGDRDADVVLALDMTAADEAHRALADEKERFRALTEQSFVGVFVLDGNRVAYANPRCAEIFGRDGSLEGLEVPAFVAEADLPRVVEAIRRLLSGESESVREEFRGVRPDGRDLVVGAQGRRTSIDGRPAVLGVLQDITEKARADALVDQYVSRLERSVTGAVGAVSRMVELRDPYTAGHERRVGEVAAAIAQEMGLDENVQQGLRIAGAVHDAGKIAVPAEILTKPGRLTRIEFDMVKAHAEQGYEVLKDIDFPWPVALVALQHHERWDGSGYPRGLKGEEILREARIVAVADVVESMASHRPYRPTRGLGVALEEIKAGAGKSYDPEVAAACLRLFWERGYQLPE